MKRLLFVLLLALLANLEASPIVISRGCVIEAENTNVNNRAEIVYYNCGTQAAFMVVAGSVGELHLRENVGRTVDIKVEVVK